MGNERVILIKGDNSKWYEQAIFIVRKNIPQNKVPVDFVLEAERIINGYVNKPEVFCGKFDGKQGKQTEKAGKKDTGFDMALNIVLLACIAILAGALAFTFF